MSQIWKCHSNKTLNCPSTKYILMQGTVVATVTKGKSFYQSWGLRTIILFEASECYVYFLSEDKTIYSTADCIKHLLSASKLCITNHFYALNVPSWYWIYRYQNIINFPFLDNYETRLKEKTNYLPYCCSQLCDDILHLFCYIFKLIVILQTQKMVH